MCRKGNPHALLVGLKIGVDSVQNSMKFLKKLEVELPYDPETSLLGIYSKKTKTLIQKNICTPMFIVALFTMS